jgi:hypothetical protein
VQACSFQTSHSLSAIPKSGLQFAFAAVRSLRPASRL